VLCRLKPTESCWYSLLFSINNWTQIHTDWHPRSSVQIRVPFFFEPSAVAYPHAKFQAFEVAV